MDTQSTQTEQQVDSNQDIAALQQIYNSLTQEIEHINAAEAHFAQTMQDTLDHANNNLSIIESNLDEEEALLTAQTKVEIFQAAGNPSPQV